MGNLAVRFPNRRLLWDGEKMEVTNDTDANAYVRRQYRAGLDAVSRAPAGMERQQRVRRAIEFRRPDRVPVVFWNRDQPQGDVMLYHLALGAPGDGSVNAWDWSVNEWGYRLEKCGDGTMGHPVQAFYRESAAGRGNPRAGPARGGAHVGRCRRSLRPAATATGWPAST